MTQKSPRAGRLPRDVRARERLREAQVQEAGAVAAVCAAQQRWSQAREKRDAALAAADAVVERAQAALEAAQSDLVGVSGLERAAMLLGIGTSELRKIVGTRAGRGTAASSRTTVEQSS